MPKDQIPMQIKASSSEGKYSTISPRGVGTNPETTIPGPFSIHMPMIDRKQATLVHLLKLVHTETYLLEYQQIYHESTL